MGLPKRVPPLSDDLRSHERTILAVSVVLDVVLVAALRNVTAIEEFTRAFASLFAALSVGSAVVLGPYIGLSTGLAAGAVYLVFVAPLHPVSSLVGAVLSVVVWSAAAAASGGLTDSYRRKIARREQELDEQRRLSEALNRIIAVVTSRLESSWVLGNITKLAAEALPADAACIAMRQDNGYVIAHAWNLPPALLGKRFTEEKAARVTQILTSRSVVGVANIAAEDPESTALIQSLGHHSVLGVPLVADGAGVGVLLFGFAERRGQFSPVELDFAGKVGVEVSQSLENAWLFERQRDIATALQEGFLWPVPHVAGLEIATAAQPAYSLERVGGDFTDVVQCEDGRVLLVVGDVQGKGVRATRLTETARSAVRALSTVSSSPGFILEHANRALLAQEFDQFVTVCVAAVDAGSGTITYASAGHPPPLLWSCGVVRRLEGARGLPLGSFPGSYEEESRPVATGDLLLLYTDGVTEAHRRGGPLFGYARLETALSLAGRRSAAEIAGSVRQAVFDFAGELRDDLQVLVARLVGVETASVESDISSETTRMKA